MLYRPESAYFHCFLGCKSEKKRGWSVSEAGEDEVGAEEVRLGCVRRGLGWFLVEEARLGC